MLVLSRKVTEKITLDVPGHGAVEIACMRIGPASVRLGITADPRIKILRTELLGSPPPEPAAADQDDPPDAGHAAALEERQERLTHAA